MKHLINYFSLFRLNVEYDSIILIIQDILNLLNDI